MTDHKYQVYYCHLSQGETVVNLLRPQGFETFQLWRHIVAPTAEVAELIYNTDLKLWGYEKKETGDDGSK